MKVLHLSDTHGTFPELPKEGWDIAIHSGDFFPNFRPADHSVERQMQTAWLHSKAVKIANWIHHRQMFMCMGNHDFASPHLNGLITDITNRLFVYDDILMYGFPYVPYFGGFWNFERNHGELQELMNRIPKVDILVSHAPPYGILDECSNGHIGVQGTLRFPPKWRLCGHVHECGGRQRQTGDTTVVNSATTMQLIEV